MRVGGTLRGQGPRIRGAEGNDSRQILRETLIFEPLQKVVPAQNHGTIIFIFTVNPFMIVDIDRIDIHIEVTPVPFEKLSSEQKAESSVEIRKRVTTARELQVVRFRESEATNYNAQMNVKQIRTYCALDDTSKQLLKTAMERLNLSARAYDRILKVSRTIADLAGSETVTGMHISEAIQYRSLDRDGWLG